MDDRGNCWHWHPALIVVLAILEYPIRGQTLLKETHLCCARLKNSRTGQNAQNDRTDYKYDIVKWR